MSARDVRFQARCKPLPPGYRVVQLDSGHYQWLGGCKGDDWTRESVIDCDRWRVRAGAFADALVRKAVGTGTCPAGAVECPSEAQLRQLGGRK